MLEHLRALVATADGSTDLSCVRARMSMHAFTRACVFVAFASFRPLASEFDSGVEHQVVRSVIRVDPALDHSYNGTHVLTHS